MNFYECKKNDEEEGTETKTFWGSKLNEFYDKISVSNSESDEKDRMTSNANEERRKKEKKNWWNRNLIYAEAEEKNSVHRGSFNFFLFVSGKSEDSWIIFCLRFISTVLSDSRRQQEKVS